VTEALDALPLFNIGVNDRMIFLTAFALAGLAALGAERLAEEGGLRRFLLAGAGTVLALVGTFLLLRPAMAEAELTSSYIGTRFALQLVPLLLAIAAVVVISRRGGTWVRLATLACLVLLLAQRGLEAGSIYPTLPGDALHPRLPIFDHIPPGEPWRFVAVGYSFVPNAPSLYEL